jgi:hypothetical protein
LRNDGDVEFPVSKAREGGLKMAKEPVRIAAVAAAAGFLVQAAFQAAIALGGASWAEPTTGNSRWVLG